GHGSGEAQTLLEEGKGDALRPEGGIRERVQGLAIERDFAVDHLTKSPKRLGVLLGEIGFLLKKGPHAFSAKESLVWRPAFRAGRDRLDVILPAEWRTKSADVREVEGNPRHHQRTGETG